MPKTWYNITSEEDSETAELAILDEISPWWGVGAREFWEDLKPIQGKELTVYINSPGGSVYEGHSIANMLIARQGVTKVVISGIAASIASVIAMAADPGELHMPLNSAMFLHLPLVHGGGNEKELEKVITDLKKIKEGIVSMYLRHATISREELIKAMEDETLYTAEEAAETFGAIVEPMVEAVASYDTTKLSNKALSFYNSAIHSKSEESSSGSKKPTKTTEDKKAMSKELESKVSSLEAENRKLVTEHVTALESTATSAKEEVRNAEKARTDGITALREKYNQKGDLDAMTIKAFSDQTTVDEFKDLVLEHITNNRKGTSAVKPNEKEEQHNGGGEDTIEALQKKITETSDSIEKGKLVQQIRALKAAKKTEKSA